MCVVCVLCQYCMCVVSILCQYNIRSGNRNETEEKTYIDVIKLIMALINCYKLDICVCICVVSALYVCCVSILCVLCVCCVSTYIDVIKLIMVPYLIQCLKSCFLAC